jgi:hypothetical protein
MPKMPIVDRATFWVVDRLDDLKQRWCRFWIADDETSRELDQADLELDLHDELDQILKAQEGRSN